MNTAKVGPEAPDKSSSSPWLSPALTWLWAVILVPVILLAVVLVGQAGLPLPDGFLNTLVPLVVGAAFASCIISIWRSSTSLSLKLLATVATVPILLIALLMALAVIFWGVR